MEIAVDILLEIMIDSQVFTIHNSQIHTFVDSHSWILLRNVSTKHLQKTQVYSNIKHTCELLIFLN